MTIAFIIIFGLIALLSKTHYKTATVICSVSIVNLLAFEWLVPIDPVSMFMILASFDMIVALFLIYVYGDGRREYMAALLILASFAHCFMGMYATFDNYIHYDLYANSITAVDLLQLVIMWGCTNARDILRMVFKFKHNCQDSISANFSYWRGHSNISLNSTNKEKD